MGIHSIVNEHKTSALMGSQVSCTSGCDLFSLCFSAVETKTLKTRQAFRNLRNSFHRIERSPFEFKSITNGPFTAVIVNGNRNNS